MNRTKAYIAIMAVALVCMAAQGAWAEEAGCYQAADNWIVRAYSTGATAPYSISLGVFDTAGGLIPAADIKGYAAMSCSNPCLLESNAQSPDLSLACDGTTAHLFHDRSGALHLTTVRDIVTPAAPVLQAPGVVNFGGVGVGGYKDMSITLLNSGNAQMQITGVMAPASPFRIVSDGCNGRTVTAGGSCVILARFQPAGSGAYSGGIAVSSDGGNAVVALEGTGLLLRYR